MWQSRGREGWDRVGARARECRTFSECYKNVGFYSEQSGKSLGLEQKSDVI